MFSTLVGELQPNLMYKQPEPNLVGQVSTNQAVNFWSIIVTSLAPRFRGRQKPCPRSTNKAVRVVAIRPVLGCGLLSSLQKQ